MTLTGNVNAKLSLFYRPHIAVLSGLLALLIGTCAYGARDDGASVTLVEERAQARWDALLAGNTELAYEFTNPGFRSAISPEGYHHRVASGTRWIAARVERVECEQRRCEVSVDVTYQLTEPDLGLDFEETFEEIWIFVDDQWWIYQRT